MTALSWFALTFSATLGVVAALLIGVLVLAGMGFTVTKTTTETTDGE